VAEYNIIYISGSCNITGLDEGLEIRNIIFKRFIKLYACSL